MGECSLSRRVAGAIHSVRSDTQGSRCTITMVHPHDDTTHGVDLVPIHVFTQETQREHLAFASSYAFQTLGHFILVGSILIV